MVDGSDVRSQFLTEDFIVDSVVSKVVENSEEKLALHELTVCRLSELDLLDESCIEAMGIAVLLQFPSVSVLVISDGAEDERTWSFIGVLLNKMLI